MAITFRGKFQEWKDRQRHINRHRRFAFPRMRKIFPSLAAEECVSIQPMTEPNPNNKIKVLYRTGPEPETDVIVSKKVELNVPQKDDHGVLPHWVKYQVTWECLGEFAKTKLSKIYNEKTDIICKFTSDKRNWYQLAGREGYVIVRDKEIIHVILTRMS